MTTDTCTACHDRPRDGDTYLCQPCADDFHAHIAELPMLAKELETELVRDTQKGSPQHGRSTELPLPFSPAASDLLHELRFWAVTTLEQFTPKDVRLEPHWEALSAMLAAREAWIVKFPTAGDVVRSLANLRAKARRLIDVPPERVIVGYCSTRTDDPLDDDNPTYCEQPIAVYERQAWWRCRSCGAAYDVGEVVEQRDQFAQDYLLPLSEIAVILGVKKSRLHSYVKRRQMFDRGRNVKGVPVYRYGDALELVNRTARKDTA